jgi:hypothetical protein
VGRRKELLQNFSYKSSKAGGQKYRKCQQQFEEATAMVVVQENFTLSQMLKNTKNTYGTR